MDDASLSVCRISQLIVGYYESVADEHNVSNACGSVTLIQDAGCNILVDTGCPSLKDVLVAKLLDHELSVGDLTHIVCTHGHIDHVGNLNLFPDAEVFLDHDIMQHGLYRNLSLSDSSSSIRLSPNVTLSMYSGHTYADLVVIASNVSTFGTVVVSGDLFECSEDIEDPSLWQANSWNVDKQNSARQAILSFADFVVPGHGPIFRVPRI